MYVKVPAEIVVHGLFDDVLHLAAYESHVVLEPVLADELHQLLEILDFGYRYAPVHSVMVIGHLAFASVSLNGPGGVVGGNPEEREYAFGNLPVYCTECVDLAQSTSENTQRGQMDIVLYE